MYWIDIERIKRFCFKPVGKDRYYWGWIFLVWAILFVITLCSAIIRHHWGCVIYSLCWTVFELFLAWFNFQLYDEWLDKSKNQ